jgi:hypothetical protein
MLSVHFQTYRCFGHSWPKKYVALSFFGVFGRLNERAIDRARIARVIRVQ